MHCTFFLYKKKLLALQRKIQAVYVLKSTLDPWGTADRGRVFIE